MKSSLPSLLVLPCILVAGYANAQAAAHENPPEERCNVLVMELEGRSLEGSDKEIPATLTESLAAEISSVSGCKVISEADLASMLKLEATKATCTDELDSCLAEIGAALGAETAISGTVGRLGDNYLLSARLIDVKSSSVLARAEETVTGGQEGLPMATKNLGRALYEKAPLEPVAEKADAPAESAPALSLPFVGGLVMAGTGVLLMAGGAVSTGIAEARMSDPASTDKGPMQLVGLVGLGGAGVGALLGVGGGALLAVGRAE